MFRHGQSKDVSEMYGGICKIRWFVASKFRPSKCLLDVENSAYLVDEWIGVAAENKVKVTDRNSIYSLPQTTFSAKLETALHLVEATLWYCRVRLTQEANARGPLLEDLCFSCSWGLERVRISKLFELESLTIHTST